MAIAAVSNPSSRASLPFFVRDYVLPGSADATAGVKEALAAAADRLVTNIPDAYNGVTARPKRPKVVFPAGLWNLAEKITIPRGVDVEIQDDALIRATAPMAAMFDTELNVVHQDGRLTCRGTIDCAGIADVGIYLRSFAHYELDLPRVYSPLVAGVILGDPASSARSYEAVVASPYIWRPNGQAVPVGSVGIWTQYCTDSDIGGPGSVVVGCDIGVRNDQGNNTFTTIHPWGYPPNAQNGQNTALMPSVCFLDNSVGATYVGCYADTPTLYGWRFTADDPRAQLVACRHYNNSQGPDGTTVAVQVDSAVTGSITALGMLSQGTSSKRVAADFAGNIGATVRFGTRTNYVLSAVGDTNPAVAVGTLPTFTTSASLSEGAAGAQINGGGSVVTVTLPAASAVVPGKTFTLKNLGTAVAYVVPPSGLIDGRGNIELGRNDAVSVFSDGSTWYIQFRSYGVGVSFRQLPSPPTSGTAYQNTSGRTVFYSLAYTPTGAGSLLVEVSIDGITWNAWNRATFTGADSARYVTFILPVNWFYRATATGATLGGLAQVA